MFLIFVFDSMHHFSFGDVVSDKVNEHEAFGDTTWSFVRPALTIVGMYTPMMEIQIDGNKDRKAEARHKGGRQSTARKADEVGFNDGNCSCNSSCKCPPF